MSDGQSTNAGFISVECLSKTFYRRRKFSRRATDVHAVRDVSMQLSRGEALGLAGESGSGKSTVARMLVGLEQPTSGRIVIAGRELTKRPTGTLRKVHARTAQMVFQDPYSSLDPRQTVRAVLDEVQRVHFERARAARETRTNQLLDAVGLSERYLSSTPRELSGGQRQRLAIARALATEAPVLVLDEAVSALDVSIQAQILNLLRDLREQLGLTYLFISHDLAVVRQVADRVVIMYRGRVVEEGRVDSVFGSPAHPYTQLLLGSVARPGRIPIRRSLEMGAPENDGCCFRHRCPKAFDHCVEEPGLLDAGPAARARCWLVNEVSHAGS